MNFFNFDLKKVFILAILVAIPLVSVNLQKSSKEGPWILQPFFFASGVTQSMYSSFSQGVRNTTDLYLNLIDVKKDNQALQQELAQLKAQLGELTELRLENERFNKLLDFKQKNRMDLLAAKIIGKDLFPDYDTVTINRGSEDGLQKGMATITIEGVVGYVVQVEPYTSQILLITDRYAVVDAIVQRSRARGILHGYSRDTCLLKYLKRNDDVKEGDLIVTSGLDNVFPKGFPIGVVTSVDRDEYSFEQTVKIQPVVSSSNLEEVFVVLNARHQDFDKNEDPEATPAETTPKPASTTSASATAPAATTTAASTTATTTEAKK